MRLLARKPVEKESFSFVSTNVTTSAYVQIVAATTQPCSAMEVFNSGGSILRIRITPLGGVAAELPYFVLPGGTTETIPVEIPKGSKIEAKAVDASSTTGYLVFNLLG